MNKISKMVCSLIYNASKRVNRTTNQKLTYNYNSTRLNKK